MAKRRRILEPRTLGECNDGDIVEVGYGKERIAVCIMRRMGDAVYLNRACLGCVRPLYGDGQHLTIAASHPIEKRLFDNSSRAKLGDQRETDPLQGGV